MELTASEQSAVKKKRRYIIQKTQVGEKAVPVHVAVQPEACPESCSTGDKSPSLSSALALDHPSSMAMAAENSVLPDTEMTASDAQIVVVTGESTLKKGRTP